jgi:hypothetical protein
LEETRGVSDQNTPGIGLFDVGLGAVIAANITRK